jgi:hypothetical protein
MVFADNPFSVIVATKRFSTPLFTSEAGQSPMLGFIQFRKVRSQSSMVLGATGYRPLSQPC